MKKLMSLALISLCLFSAVPVALAAGLTYELPDLDMTIDAPQGWVVFTRDVKEDDPNIELMGMNSKELADRFKNDKIYLYMIDKDAAAQIIMTMTEDEISKDIFDMSSVSESEIRSEMESLIETQEMNDEIKYLDYSIYKHKQATFMVLSLTQQINGITAYGKQYITLINGKDIQIMLHSYGSEISDSLAETIQDTVDSITFTEVRQKKTRLSAFFTIAMNIAAVFGIVWLIAFLINRRKKPKLYRPLPGRYL